MSYAVGQEADEHIEEVEARMPSTYPTHGLFRRGKRLAGGCVLERQEAMPGHGRPYDVAKYLDLMRGSS